MRMREKSGASVVPEFINKNNAMAIMIVKIVWLFIVKIIVIFHCIDVTVTSSERTWVKESSLSGLKPNIGTFIDVRSKIDCGQTCSKNSLCVSYFFTPDISNGCQLLDFIIPSADGLQISSTTSYYVPRDTFVDPYEVKVLSDGTYLRLRIGLTPLTNQEAEINCSIDGGHLVQINSAPKMDKLRQILQEYNKQKQCLNVPSTEYTGTLAITLDGEACHRWDDYNDYTDADFPDGSETNAQNYCRDPSASGSLWCTTSSGWGYCLILSCDNVMEHQSDMCYHSGISTEYTGTWNMTGNGNTCQRWDVNSPHAHSYHTDSMFPDGSEKLAENYCRDPGGDGYTWCHTTDPSIEWEACHALNCVRDAPERKCFDAEKSAEYAGTWNLTSSGIVCRQWTLQEDYDQSSFPDPTLEEAQNYCRDPDDTGYLWCYTVDDSVSWEFCDLPKCDGSEGFHVQADNLADINTWLDNDGNVVHSSAWALGKPDYPHLEHCARMDRKYDWYLNDGSCSWKSWFICEK